MSDPKLESAFSIFKKSVGQNTEKRKRVYTDGLVLWLGVWQELQMLSCAESLDQLGNKHVMELMGDCARRGNGGLSRNTGALVQARQMISSEVLREALHATYRYVHAGRNWKGLRVVGVDGSTIQLSQSNLALRQAFPGGTNGKRVSRWPLVHLALCVDLLEGTIVSANIGSKYGKNAQSEQVLSEPFFEHFDDHTLLIADRNFATFNTVKQLKLQGAKGLLRLKVAVARTLLGGSAPKSGLDQEVDWKCTSDMAAKYGYKEGEAIRGRIIAQKVTSGDKTTLAVFFTTLTDETPEVIVELYKKRWAIETDLKTMKQQLRLRSVRAGLVRSAEVEIFCKFLSFNITRGMVLLAVEETDIEPRRISFKRAFSVMRQRLPAYEYADTPLQKDEIIDRTLSGIRDSIIPHRPNRSYPRQMYDRRLCRYKKISSDLKKSKRH